MATNPRALARRYMSPRFQRLDRLERFVEGTQYEGRPGFLSRSTVPLLERAPNLVYPIFANAIRSNADFTLGEGRWPAISSASSEDDRKLDPASGLTKDESDATDAGIGNIVDQARLKAVFRELLESAQGVSSCVAVASVRRGRLHVETVKAAWCTPTLDPVSGACTTLAIQYPYIEPFYDAARRKWAERCMLYRRVIDGTADVTFAPMEAPQDPTRPITWTEATRNVHGLGFCPVHWYAFRKPCSALNDYDGRALHENLLDEGEALDFALSQRHRAALYCGDPQMWATGVSKGDVGGTGGRTAVDPKFQATEQGWTGAPQAVPAGRKGAGVVWSSESPEAKYGMLVLPGDGLKALDDHIRDLKGKIQESLAVVDIDIENANLASDTSAKALEVLHRRQIDACNKIREEFGDGCMLPIVDMLLRVCLVVGRAKPGGIYLAGIDKMLPILARFEREIAPSGDAVAANDGEPAKPVKQWIGPQLDLLWGPYFRNTAFDQVQILQVNAAALDQKCITRVMAIEKLKSEGIYPIGSAQELAEAIDAESVERVALQQTLMPALPAPTNEPPPANGKPNPFNAAAA